MEHKPPLLEDSNLLQAMLEYDSRLDSKLDPVRAMLSAPPIWREHRGNNRKKLKFTLKKTRRKMADKSRRNQRRMK
jgi:hypothetical protein